MSRLTTSLREMYSPERLEVLDRVADHLKENPESLDTHSRDVRSRPNPVSEKEDGKA